MPAMRPAFAPSLEPRAEESPQKEQALLPGRVNNLATQRFLKAEVSADIELQSSLTMSEDAQTSSRSHQPLLSIALELLSSSRIPAVYKTLSQGKACHAGEQTSLDIPAEEQTDQSSTEASRLLGRQRSSISR